MVKVDATVRKETLYIAVFSAVLGAVMQIVFVAANMWDYAVLFGNLLSYAVSLLNFLFMGLTVQKAVMLEEKEARKLMKSSQSLRTAGMFVALALGAALPVFNTVAVIIPLFFTRVAVAFRPLIKDKKEVKDK